MISPLAVVAQALLDAGADLVTDEQIEAAVTEWSAG